jgi:hypothetical protein
MRVIEAVAARLDQSVKVAANLGIDLLTSGLSSENQIRNAIWRCILCTHGSACAEWIKARKPGVPGFCANREFYLGLFRDVT